MFRCEMGDRNISKYLSTALTDVKNMKSLVVDGRPKLTLKLRIRTRSLWDKAKLRS